MAEPVPLMVSCLIKTEHPVDYALIWRLTVWNLHQINLSN